MSAPATANAIWFTTSGITGLTLPGMIDDPACRAGSVISPSPACGPDASSRRSLQIFESLAALRLTVPDSVMKAPASLVASIRSGAVTMSSPLATWSCRRTSSRYCGSAVMPVPIAVAPRFVSASSGETVRRSSTSSWMVCANPVNSCPRVIGTASCSCVRPIFSTSWKARPRSAKASDSRSSSPVSRRTPRIIASLMLVG